MQKALGENWVTLATAQFWNFGPKFRTVPEVCPNRVLHISNQLVKICRLTPKKLKSEWRGY